MLNFKGFLLEVLDQPYSVKMIDRDDNFYMYGFNTDDGRRGKIVFHYGRKASCYMVCELYDRW